eukprot:2654680-Rhodomonas_salina.1
MRKRRRRRKRERGGRQGLTVEVLPKAENTPRSGPYQHTLRQCHALDGLIDDESAASWEGCIGPCPAPPYTSSVPQTAQRTPRMLLGSLGSWLRVAGYLVVLSCDAKAVGLAVRNLKVVELPKTWLLEAGGEGEEEWEERKERRESTRKRARDRMSERNGARQERESKGERE